MQQEASLPQKFAKRDYPLPECNKIKHRPTRLKSYIHPILSLLNMIAEVGNIEEEEEEEENEKERKKGRKKEFVDDRIAREPSNRCIVVEGP